MTKVSLGALLYVTNELTTVASLRMTSFMMSYLWAECSPLMTINHIIFMAQNLSQGS